MTATLTADVQHARANRLYWNSSDTVDRIAEQLGMSRNALYAAVRPEPAGRECPDCGDELVFPNRSSRTAGRVMCLGCDRTAALEELPWEDEPAGRNGFRHVHAYEGREAGYGDDRGGALGGLRDGLAAVEPERAAMIGGAAVLGAVAGVAAINLLRRMY